MNIPIINNPTVTINQMKQWAASKGAKPFFIDLADTFYTISKSVGVDPAVVYAQSAKETGYGKFGGVIDESFCNPCGMKTTNGGGDTDPSAHKRFTNWNEGITAHVDHLALYAGQQGYPKPNTPDPRHFPYLKDTAMYVENLGSWATDGSYAKKLIEMINEMRCINVGVNPKNIIICLDAGHGGTDPGACGKVIGLMEKNCTLKIVQNVNALLLKQGYQTVLTRTNDTFISLGQRCTIANNAKVDQFISVHINSVADPSASGTEVLVYKKDGKITEKFATLVQDKLMSNLKLKNRGVKENSDLVVLNGTSMPACLIEVCFISNAVEENLLIQEKFLDLTALSIVQACNEFFGVVEEEVMTVEKALNILVEKEIINSLDYWMQHYGDVPYLDKFIINAGEYVK